MMRNAMLSLLVLSTLIAVAGHASAATSTPYAVPTGQTLPFVVMGTSASLSEILPGAFIVNTVDLPGGLLRVNVHCDGAVLCTGLVVGA